MSLVRWSPVRELAGFPRDPFTLNRDMSSLIDDVFRGSLAENLAGRDLWSPAVDVAEHEGEYRVKVEIPGVSKEDVKITIEDNILTVRGEKKFEKETKDSSYHRIERSYGSFERSFSLPETVQADKVGATYADGILTIALPKAEEAKSRLIDVKVK